MGYVGQSPACNKMCDTALVVGAGEETVTLRNGWAP